MSITLRRVFVIIFSIILIIAYAEKWFWPYSLFLLIGVNVVIYFYYIIAAITGHPDSFRKNIGWYWIIMPIICLLLFCRLNSSFVVFSEYINIIFIGVTFGLLIMNIYDKTYRKYKE